MNVGDQGRSIRVPGQPCDPAHRRYNREKSSDA